MSTKPSLVLVHGAWHGSWCWENFIPELSALGYDDVRTVDLPCTSGKAGTTQFDDAAAVRAVVESVLAASKDVVVVAHSYGGAIGSGGIYGIANGHLLGLIDVCAFILPGGMDQGKAIRDAGGLPYVDWDTPSAGLFLPKDPRSMFFPPDVPADRVDWALARLQPQSMAANTGIVPPQAWEDEKYSAGLGYIRCTEDAIVPIAAQDSMVASAGGSERWITRTLEGSGHSPFLSRPKELAVAVNGIVQEFQKPK